MRKLNLSVVVVGLILLAGILGVIIFFSFTSSKTSLNGKPVPTFIVENQIATPTQLTSLKLFQSNQFSILYPNDWIPEKKDVYGGGSIFLIKPVSANFPNISIQITPFHQNDIDTLEAIFELSKFQKSSAIVNGVPATKYTGIIKETAETSYVFSYNTTAFLLKFEDNKNSTAQDNTRLFSQMLASFQIVR